MEEKLVDYARIVALMAQEGVLEETTAVNFCKLVVPQLIAELEIMRRVAQAAFPVPAPAQPEPATQEKDSTPAKPRRKATKKVRKKGGRNGRVSS